MITRSEIMTYYGKAEVVSVIKVQKAIVATQKVFSDGRNLFVQNEQNLYLKLKSTSANLEIRRLLFEADAQAEISKSKMQNILDNLLVDTRLVKESINLNLERYINFQNGVFDLADKKLFDKDDAEVKDLKFSYKIAADYIKIEHPIKQLAKFKSFIEETFDCQYNDDTWAYILANLGYLISSVNTLRKAVIFIGVSASGKSTLADFIGRSIFPNNEVAHVSFQDLGHRFRLYEAAVAKINISNEINKTIIRNLANFKSLTAGEEIVVECKGKDPVAIKPNVRQLYCANYLPNFDDGNAAAIFDRLNLLIFRKSVNEAARNVNLLQDFLDEKNAILSRAVDKFSDVFKRGYFNVPKDMMDFKYEAMIEDSAIDLFINENLSENVSAVGLSTTQVFIKYEKFCVDNGFSKKSKKDLRTAILIRFPTVKIKKKRLPENVRAYLNLEYKISGKK